MKLTPFVVACCVSLSAQQPFPNQPLVQSPSQTRELDPAQIPGLPGRRPGTERWIVLFNERGFTLETYRDAIRAGLPAPTVERIVADLEVAMRADQADFERFANAAGGELTAQWWLINGCAVEIDKRGLAALQRHPRVAAVYPDRLHRAMSPRRVHPLLQGDAAGPWNHGAVSAHSRGFTGRGPTFDTADPSPTLAVLDTQLEWRDLTNPSYSTWQNHRLFDDATGTSRIVASVRVANLPAGVTPAQNHQNSPFNALANFPGQHGSGVAHPAVGAVPPGTTNHGTGQAPGARIVCVDIIEDPAQLNAVFGCTAPGSRFASTISITDGMQWVATNKATYSILTAVCSYGGSGNPWAPEQQALDSLSLNAEVLVTVPSGNYFADDSISAPHFSVFRYGWQSPPPPLSCFAQSVGAGWQTGLATPIATPWMVDHSVYRGLTCWDSMYGANALVVGAAEHDSRIVPSWSGAGPMTNARSQQPKVPMGCSSGMNFGSTFCSGFLPDAYFATPSDFSRDYPDLIACGSAVVVGELEVNGMTVDEILTSGFGTSIATPQVAGAGFLFRAGVDDVLAGPGFTYPTVQETRAVLLATSEDASGNQPFATPMTGQVGENLHGAGFLRTDRSVDGPNRTTFTGALGVGQSLNHSLVVNGDREYGIALVWDRTVFTGTPPYQAQWPTLPPTTGPRWADFDMTVTGPGVTTAVASTFGNRTWEHARVTPNAGGTLTVQVTRTPTSGGATSESYTLVVVALRDVPSLPLPAWTQSTPGSGPLPCMSETPSLGGVLNQLSTQFPTTPSFPTYGVFQQGSNSFPVNGARTQGWEHYYTTPPIPGFTGIGRSLDITAAIPPAILGPIGIQHERPLVRFHIRDVGTPPSTTKYLAVDMVCEAERDMQIPMTLRGLSSGNTVELAGTLDVRAGSSTARAVFRRPSNFSGLTSVPVAGWVLRDYPGNPTPGINGWHRIVSQFPEVFQVEFRAPKGLRFERPFEWFSMQTQSMGTLWTPAGFTYMAAPIEYADPDDNPVTFSTGGSGNVVLSAILWSADSTFGAAAPTLSFTGEAPVVGKTYSVEARGFEVGAARVGSLWMSLATGGAATLGAGVTNGQACECFTGVSFAAGQFLLDLPLTVSDAGAVGVQGLFLPYEQTLLGVTLYHQFASLEPRGANPPFIRSSNVGSGTVRWE